MNNEFWVFDVTSTALKNINSPTQTISRTVDGVIHADDQQKYVNMQFAQSGNRLFFAGKHVHPGYLQVAADNESLEVVYINIITRNENATTTNARVQNNSKYYDCYKTHTSASDNEPGVGADWEQYWFINDGSIPSGTASWSSGADYTTTMLDRYDKYTSVVNTDTFPTTVAFFAGRAFFAGDPKYPNTIYFS